MQLVRTSSTHPHFKALTEALDAELNARYGRSQKAYDIHNVIEPIETAIIGYVAKRPVACGCFKPIDARTVEIKRMFVGRDSRRSGCAQAVLQALEDWSAELGHRDILLETGKGQPEAIALYRRCGYRIIDNYGPYQGMANSVCFAKRLATIQVDPPD